MDADEFAEWRIYLAENPLPDWWRMVGQICMIVHNAWAKKPRKMEHFMPEKRPKPVKDNF
jgi:hypothetical protein